MIQDCCHFNVRVALHRFAVGSRGVTFPSSPLLRGWLHWLLAAAIYYGGSGNEFLTFRAMLQQYFLRWEERKGEEGRENGKSSWTTVTVDRRELGGKNKSNRWWICRTLWPRWTVTSFMREKRMTVKYGWFFSAFPRPPLIYFFHRTSKSQNVVEILLWPKCMVVVPRTRDINGESFPLILECTAGFAQLPLPPHYFIRTYIYQNVEMR